MLNFELQRAIVPHPFDRLSSDTIYVIKHMMQSVCKIVSETQDEAYENVAVYENQAVNQVPTTRLVITIFYTSTEIVEGLDFHYITYQFVCVFDCP